MGGQASLLPHSHTPTEGPLIAYFSAEFGLTDCLSIFAGGLGGLAGDHLKSASDLGAPLAGVGLLYQQGYFGQYLNEAGWQQEVYEDNDFYNLPLTLERRIDGTSITLSIPYPGRQVIAQVWRVQVGAWLSTYWILTSWPTPLRTGILRTNCTVVMGNWMQVRVEAVETGFLTELQVGSKVYARAQVHLGTLMPDDVAVELYMGRVAANGEIVEAETTPMQPVKPVGEGSYLFETNAIPCNKSGLHGYTLQVFPRHPDLSTSLLPGFIVWAGSDVNVK